MAQNPIGTKKNKKGESVPRNRIDRNIGAITYRTDDGGFSK